MFATEEMLVDSFVDALQSSATPWGVVQVLREFFYARGRTDVVAVSDRDTLIAFEAKLQNWRTALQQAYRNTCFAHSSYVLLPKKAAMTANRYSAEFENRGVGLCYMDGADLVILQESSVNEPLEPWLAVEARLQARK